MPHRRRGTLSKSDLLVVELSKAKLSSIYLTQTFFGCPRCRFYAWVLSQRSSAYSASAFTPTRTSRYLFFFPFFNFHFSPAALLDESLLLILQHRHKLPQLPPFFLYRRLVRLVHRIVHTHLLLRFFRLAQSPVLQTQIVVSHSQLGLRCYRLL